MRSNTWRALILFSLTLMLVSTAMDAQAARRSSLAGNQFIEDADDMFAFPQLTMKYKNRVIIDMAPNSYMEYYDPIEDEYVYEEMQHGNGSIIFGDNTVWNFNTGRGSFLNNTATWAYGGADRFSNYPMFGVLNSSLISELEAELGIDFPGSSVEWWDLGFATHLGDTPFGFNISWASSSHEFTHPSDAVPNEEMSSSQLSFQLGATLGSVDLAGEVGFGSHSDKSEGLDPQNQNDYSLFNFTLLARGLIEDAGGLDWRWIGAFTSGSTSPDGADESLTTTAFRGSFGPIWGTPGEWEVAAYMNFDYMKQSLGGDDYVSAMSFPGYNLAMEYYLNSWLVGRGGVVSSYAMTTISVELSDTEKSEQKDKMQDLAWTLGLGVDKGNWGLDLALAESDVHSGYLPFNGDTSDPLAYITAWLAW